MKDEVRSGPDLKIYGRTGILWWAGNNCKHNPLTDFSILALSCCSTSCSLERSFSVQGHVDYKAQNRLKEEQVAKIMFCKWNISMMHGMDRFNKEQFWYSLQQVQIVVVDFPSEGTTASLTGDTKESGESSNGDDDLREDDKIQLVF